MNSQAYPLEWPQGRRRWEKSRVISQFKMFPAQMKTELFDELDHMNAKDIVISTNREPFSRSSKYLEDPGVAVYFTRKGQELCIACDKYIDVNDNLHAIGIAIKSFRTLERHGTGEMVDAALRGFTALPESIIVGPGQSRAWHEVLQVASDADQNIIKAAYRNLAARYHPDNQTTGNPGKFAEVQKAYDEARK